MEWKMMIVQVGLILLLGELTTSASGQENKVRLVEHIDDGKSIEEIADILCGPHDGNYQLFIKFGTPQQLVDYMGGCDDDYIVKCWAKYGDAISLLNKIIRTSSYDVCAGKKISLIEEFHRKYISKTRKDVTEREANHYAVPQMLTIFFIYYADKVGQICKLNLPDNVLDLASNEDASVVQIINDKQPAKIDNLLNRFDKSFDSELVTRYQESMSLFWDLVDTAAFDTPKNDEFFRYVNVQADDEPTRDETNHRVTLKMKATSNILTLQAYCRDLLRPIYSRTVMPVLRLIGLGYYFEQIFSLPDRWYKITQLCEMILPVRVIADDSLADGQVVIIPKDEAAELLKSDLSSANSAPEAEEPKRELKVGRNAFSVNALWWLVSDEMMKTAEKLKDINDRQDVVKRYLARMAPNFAELTQSNEGIFFLEASNGGQREDLTSALAQKVPEFSAPTEGPIERACQLVRGVWNCLWAPSEEATNQSSKTLSSAFALVAAHLVMLAKAA